MGLERQPKVTAVARPNIQGSFLQREEEEGLVRGDTAVPRKPTLSRPHCLQGVDPAACPPLAVPTTPAASLRGSASS